MRTERRQHVSRLGALAAAGSAFVGVPWLLINVCRWRLGSASPLTGIDAPWRWTVDGVRRWVGSLRHGLSSTDQLVDLFVRLATIAAWCCVAILAWTVVAEVVHQLRYGLPSGRRRSILGIGRSGRWIAAGLIGLLPAAPSAVAQSHMPAARHAAVVQHQRLDPVIVNASDSSVGAHLASGVEPGGTSAAPPVHRVRAGESVWTIAEHYATPDAVDEMAATIARLNVGRVMSDGARFVTAALIEPGWDLLLPSGVETRSTATEAGPARSAEPHVVTPGESYWRIADEHLEEASSATDVSDREVLAYVDDLMAINVTRLGYDNPKMIHPGDRIFFEADTTPVVSSVSPDSEPAGLPLLPPPVFTQPSAPSTTSSDASPGPSVASTEQSVVPTTIFDDASPPHKPVSAEVPVSPSHTTPLSTTAPGTTPTEDTVAPFVDPPADTASPRRLPIGFVGGGFLAAGAVAVVVRRRREALRRATVLQRVERRSSEVADNEALLRRCSDEERIVRLDLALRAAAADLADQQAQVTWVQLGWDGELRLGLDVSALPIGPLWKLGFERNSWVLPAAVATRDLAADSRRSAQPCPTLVMLGTTDDGELYVDLEACGVLCMDGLDELVRAVGATLAVSPMAQPMSIEAVGAAELESYNAVVNIAADLSAALDALDGHRSKLAVLDGGSSMFRLRARRFAVGSSEPMVVVAVGSSVDGELARRLTTFARPGQGTAVVIDAAVGGVTHVVRPVDAERCRIEPFGIVFQPIALNPLQAADIADVLRLEVVDDGSGVEGADGHPAISDPGGEVGDVGNVVDQVAAVTDPEDASPRTDDDPDRDVDAVSPVVSGAAGRPQEGACSVQDVDAVPGDDPFPDPDVQHRLVVRLLGPVGVETTEGAAVEFERSKALELVVWMSQHRQRGLRAQARAALWDLDVRDSTFANVVSDARRAMARAVSTSDGEEWIGRSIGDRLPLHDEVTTDAEMLGAALQAVIERPSPRRWVRLDLALDAIRGIPLSGTSYLWADGEGITSSLILLATNASVVAANHALELDDIDGVFRATQRGLAALPGHEELVALRMRAHAQRGDRAGVRQEWESYERAVRSDSWSSGEPSPKLVAVRRELLGYEPHAGPGAP